MRALLDLLRERGAARRAPRGLRALRGGAGATMKRLYYVGLVLAIVALDQFTKWLIVSSMELHEYRSLIDGLLSLSHVHNRGAPFGTLPDADPPHPPMLFSVLSLFALG